MLDSLVAFVPSHDLVRSREFYEGVLGLDVVETDDFAVTLASGPTRIRVTAVEGWSAQGYTVLGWTVSDIEAELARLVEAGVRTRRYDGMGQDDNGVWTAPSGHRVAWFVDPDGNVLSLTQPPVR